MGTALPASSAMRRLDSGRDAKVLTAACGRPRSIGGGCRLGTGAPVPSRQPPPTARVQPQAAVKTFASRPEAKRRIAELAGNAVPMELMLVVLRALAHCYPAVFRVWEPLPAGAAGASPAASW